jgi:hypothetical protein
VVKVGQAVEVAALASEQVEDFQFQELPTQAEAAAAAAQVDGPKMVVQVVQVL